MPFSHTRGIQRLQPIQYPLGMSYKGYWPTGFHELLGSHRSVHYCLSAFPHEVGRALWVAVQRRGAHEAWKVVSTNSHFWQGAPMRNVFCLHTFSKFWFPSFSSPLAASETISVLADMLYPPYVRFFWPQKAVHLVNWQKYRSLTLRIFALSALKMRVSVGLYAD